MLANSIIEFNLAINGDAFGSLFDWFSVTFGEMVCSIQSLSSRTSVKTPGNSFFPPFRTENWSKFIEYSLVIEWILLIFFIFQYWNYWMMWLQSICRPLEDLHHYHPVGKHKKNFLMQKQILKFELSGFTIIYFVLPSTRQHRPPWLRHKRHTHRPHHCMLCYIHPVEWTLNWRWIVQATVCLKYSI